MLTFYARPSCTYSMSLCFSDISSDERLACLLHTTFMHTQILYTHTQVHTAAAHTHTQSHLSCTDILSSTNQLPVSQCNLIGHFWAVSRYRKFLHDIDLCFTWAVGGVITLLSATVKDPDFEKSWGKIAVNTDEVVA